MTPLAPLLLAAAFDVTSVQQLWALPFPATQKDPQGRDLIHVRIYPHEQKVPAKRAAEPLDHVVVEGPCELYAGKPNLAAATGKKLTTLKPGASVKLDLTMAKLKAPVWLECSGPVTVHRGEPLESHKYEANLYIHKGDSKEIPTNPHVEIIAVMPVDTYLRGVVPTEAIPSWPADALKTQAIAARSYAYFNISHNEHFPNPKIYDVDDTNHFQAFSGLTTVTEMTDKAVAETKGEILMYQGKIVPGFFDTDAGGQTESAKEVFDLAAPYCPVKAEPPEVVQAVKPWTETVKLAEVAHQLGGHIPAGRSIKNLTVAAGDVTPGKRVRKVTADLDNGTKVEIPIADFKKIGPAPGLKSALFTLAVSGDSVKIDGKGSGHGVGLDQIGMHVLAKAGWDYKKILSFYFTGTTLCTAPCGAAQPLAH